MMEFQGFTYVVKAKNSCILVSRSRVFSAISKAFGRSGESGIEREGTNFCFVLISVD
jgi:hypothetical protein